MKVKFGLGFRTFQSKQSLPRSVSLGHIRCGYSQRATPPAWTALGKTRPHGRFSPQTVKFPTAPKATFCPISAFARNCDNVKLGCHGLRSQVSLEKEGKPGTSR
jgi:hypothetical protein